MNGGVCIFCRRCKSVASVASVAPVAPVSSLAPVATVATVTTVPTLFHRLSINRNCLQPFTMHPSSSINLHTTSKALNSGKFKKIKSQPDTYFQRKLPKDEEESNFLFSREYLDRTVVKLLSSGRRNKYSFLNTSRQSLPINEPVDARENVARNWNHISETVQDLGIPEFADVIGGQMFAGGHLRETTTCCLTVRLADSISLLTDLELLTCLEDVSVWPSDVSSSEVLSAVFRSMDKELGSRCRNWETVDNLERVLLWSRGPSRTKEKVFQRSFLASAQKDVLEFSLQDCINWLLFCSYESNLASEIVLEEEQKKYLEETLLTGFHSLTETELGLVYHALSTILRHKPVELKTKIESSYGFRL